MLALGFHNVAWLIGLAGAAVPVLIHLLTRDRIRRVQFSTLRFFVKGSRRVLRRKRLREMLLLLLRAAVCALLALAFARPFFSDEGPAERVSKARVVVLDVSGSMHAPGRMEFAREKAEEAFDELSSGTDAAALVTFSELPTVVVPLTRTVSNAEDAVGEIEPGYARTNVIDALVKADELLRGVKAREKRIVLISDLQRSGWAVADEDGRLPSGQAIKDLRLHSGADLDIQLAAGDRDKMNVAVMAGEAPSSASLGAGPSEIRVELDSFPPPGGEATDVKVSVVLKVAPPGADALEEVARKQVQVTGDQAVPVRFDHEFDREGSNRGAVVVEADDAVAEDNVFRFATRAVARRVALLTPHLPDGEDEALYVQLALVPDASAPMFQVLRIATADRADAVAARAVAEIGNASVAVLVNVADAAPQVREALEAMLDRGGGAFFLPGDLGADGAERFNRTFGDLAPARLVEIARPRGGYSAGEAVLDDIDFDHPIFRSFRVPRPINMTAARFFRYWEVRDSQSGSVLARFSDGRPAVLERRVRKGTTTILLSPPDPEWNNLGPRWIFAPYVHETIGYLAARGEERTVFTVGDRIRVPAGHKLTGPEGKTHDAGATLRAEKPGFYSLVHEATGDEQVLAVNPVFSEADASPEEPAKVAASYRTWQELGKAVPADDAVVTRTDEDDSRLWWYVLVALGGLAVGELALANRTQRH
jgi:hypothetical protein